MPGRIAGGTHLEYVTRAARCLGLAAFLVVLGSESLQNAIAEGDTRTISLHHLHTGEDITVTYKRNGRYDDGGLKKLNWILRDWRRDEEIRMEPRLIDLVWEVQRDLGAKEKIQIVSGYRAPQTNAMLRHRGRGVARFSQHMLGKAMDFYIPGVSLNELRAAGLRLQRGGVGFYPTSGSPFVHLDVGSVRHWPRMTHEQLARVFPDGRTVHIPTDGHPLPGYALALADVEKRGSAPSAVSLEAARNNGVNTNGTSEKPSLLAKLFGFGKSKDEEEEADAGAATALQASSPRPKMVATETKKPDPAQTLAAIPLPKVRPALAQVATAQSSSDAPARPAQATSLYAVASASPPTSANTIFERRGYWHGLPDHDAGITRVADATTSKARLAATDPAATGSISPWASPGDRGSSSMLAYAAPIELKADPTLPMGSFSPQASAESGGASIALKRDSARPPAAKSKAVAKASSPIMMEQPFDDPWLRAVMLTPTVSAMTTTVLGAPDFRRLRPLLQRPFSMVVMTFSDDPFLGMSARTFTGDAVSFLATATFSSRTAALQ